MKAVKVSLKVKNIEQAYSMLRNASNAREFLFGYVDESAMCCVYFHSDDSTVRPLRADEERVFYCVATQSSSINTLLPIDRSIPEHTFANGHGDFRDAPRQEFHEK